eukprot:5432236-Amphidinium_carterae.1
MSLVGPSGIGALTERSSRGRSTCKCVWAQNVRVHRIPEGLHMELSELLVEGLEGLGPRLRTLSLQHVLSGRTEQGRRVGLRLHELRLPHVLGRRDGLGGCEKLQRGRRSGPAPLDAALSQGKLKQLSVCDSERPNMPERLQQLAIRRIMRLRPR